MKGYGKNSKNSGTGDATSYHSKRKQTVRNLFSDLGKNGIFSEIGRAHV